MSARAVKVLVFAVGPFGVLLLAAAIVFGAWLPAATERSGTVHALNAAVFIVGVLGFLVAIVAFVAGGSRIVDGGCSKCAQHEAELAKLRDALTGGTP